MELCCFIRLESATNCMFDRFFQKKVVVFFQITIINITDIMTVECVVVTEGVHYIQ